MIKSSRKTFSFLPFLAFSLMLICASASFSAVLFEEDFEEGIDENVWNPHEAWEEADGVLDWVAPGAFCLGYTVRDDFTDFFMFADVNVGNDVAFAVRVQDDQNYYMFQYDLGTNPNSFWWCIYSNGDFALIEELPAQISPELGKWYQMQLIAEGHHFEVYLGELGQELELSGTWDDEAETFDSGSIGFWQYVGENLYDNILVTDLAGAAVVSKNGGLPTTWGNIKSRY